MTQEIKQCKECFYVYKLNDDCPACGATNSEPLTNEPYWNVEKDGSEGGIQADSLEQAQELADAAFAEEMENSGENMRDGQQFEADCVFIKYEYDRELDDYKETERKPGLVTYEYYHGDFAEHNTYGD